jgi:hypothetical protein
MTRSFSYEAIHAFSVIARKERQRLTKQSRGIKNIDKIKTVSIFVFTCELSLKFSRCWIAALPLVARNDGKERVSSQ